MNINDYASLIEYIEKNKDNSKKLRIIKERFKKYIELCGEENIIDFLDKVKDMPEMELSLHIYSDFIYEKYGLKAILKITEKMDFKKRFEYIYEIYEGVRLKYYTIDEFFEDLIKNGEISYIANNMKEIVIYGDIKTLIKKGLLKQMKQIDEEKFNQIHFSIVCKMTGIKPKCIDNTTLSGLTIIVNEIAKNENVDISDLEYVDKGTMNYVYKLGNKVIKFGENRLTNQIPYHKRILQPLIRRKILKGFRDLYIEISEYIPPDKNITDEDAYLIYKELRNDGIIWLDAKRENLGRLQKDNVAHFKEPLYVKNETVGYITKTIKKEEPLHKGDVVIIDTDFLYREKDFKLKNIDNRVNTDFYKICEKRYQAECSKAKIVFNKLKRVIERI